MVEVPQLPNHLYFSERTAFRAWLAEHHATATEIWLCEPDVHTALPRMPYLDSVLEGLCFGWIDGVAKRIDDHWVAQRYTPRKPKGRWTELNKHRARQLIEAGRMTAAGLKTLPPLDTSLFSIASDILASLQEDADVWSRFQQMPPAYVRIRIDYIEERRRLPVEFQKSLSSFKKKTLEGKLYGYFLPEIGYNTAGKEILPAEHWLGLPFPTAAR